MISVAMAQSLVLDHTRPLPPMVTPVAPEALGLILAEEVVSDLDMPPFDKALMDGYAVRTADLATSPLELRVIEEVTAGQTPRLPLGPGQATRIMTGAPLPAGADAVVQVEHTHPLEEDRVGLANGPVAPERNILRRGREMRVGQVVLSAGTKLRPHEIGILATVGRTRVKVYLAPRVAILSTGDEIVDGSQQPGPGHIRNGNGPMLGVQVWRAGAQPLALGIALDTPESLRPLIDRGLRQHVLLLSGGVSAGKLDLVPGVLRDLGVQPHFHKVEMKPGKPVFFGTRGETLVFGLPGNPVSAMVCFELFVRPALRRLRNEPEVGPRVVQAVLDADFAYRSDRPTYHPAQLSQHPDGRWQVKAVPWFGSPDMLALAQANALMVIPAGGGQYARGDVLEVVILEGRD